MVVFSRVATNVSVAEFYKVEFDELLECVNKRFNREVTANELSLYTAERFDDDNEWEFEEDENLRDVVREACVELGDYSNELCPETVENYEDEIVYTEED